MNILFFTSLGVTPFCGGIERFALELGKQFTEDGHNVYYISLSKAKVKESPKWEAKINQWYLDMEVSSVEKIEYLRKLLVDKDIDILFNQQGDSIEITSLCCQARVGIKTKLISIFHFDPLHYLDIYDASCHDIYHSCLPLKQKLDLFIKNTRLFRFYQKRKCGNNYRSIYWMSDAFVLLSEKAKPRFLNMTGIKDTSRLFAISNPITNIHTDKEVAYKENIILFVGRLVFLQKRPDIMLEVWSRIFKEFPGWYCKVLGNGTYYNQMRKRIEESGIERIELCGYANSDDYYKSAKILCVTSNTEGFSLVITEAANNRVVPLAFDSFSAVTDVIQDGKTGFIIPKFDIDKYVMRLKQLMSEPNLLHQMSLSAHEYCKRFDKVSIARQWYSLFERVR